MGMRDEKDEKDKSPPSGGTRPTRESTSQELQCESKKINREASQPNPRAPKGGKPNIPRSTLRIPHWISTATEILQSILGRVAEP
jgi:hypothetical protein